MLRGSTSDDVWRGRSRIFVFSVVCSVVSRDGGGRQCIHCTRTSPSTIGAGTAQEQDRDTHKHAWRPTSFLHRREKADGPADGRTGGRSSSSRTPQSTRQKTLEADLSRRVRNPQGVPRPVLLPGCFREMDDAAGCRSNSRSLPPTVLCRCPVVLRREIGMCPVLYYTSC